MGDYEGWAQPSGHLPNGLLLNEAASVTRVLHPGRWSKAEERTAELIACIQPNKLSQERRNAVADYVQRLIGQCFSCQVFTFGSVPLKTYLPDGDIDLTVFSKNENLKDTWANMVRDMLENEEKSETAEFHVKEVQYIQAEVKIIKCLVENIVVDISFNQLGGLCTLCFLEEVDHLINQNHLFKRSIILIKTWCYYESRILGAHHGLISTYALETLVLYIFHVFNNSLSGPLEVLYRFLEFFSNFDWDNFCVSLWGPVPISSLPDMTAEPPRKDGRELLLSKLFLDACSSVYAVFPGGQENHGQPFVSKNINIVDPLRTNNNLGRSVNKGNFFRIRSAFAFGAKRLARLLDCPTENLIGEVDQFFMNTWERHGTGHRPDAASSLSLLPLNPDHFNGADKLKNDPSNKKKMEVSGHESEVESLHSFRDISYQQPNQLSENISRTTNVPRTQSQKNYGNQIRSRVSEQLPRNINSSEVLQTEKGQRRFRPDHLTNEVQGRFQFVRTRSSPELTDTSNDVSLVRHNRVYEMGKGQIPSSRPDYSRRKNSEVLGTHSARSSNADSSSLRHSSSHQSLDSAGDSNTYQDGVGFGPFGVELASVAESMEMHQEEQDLVNMMASSRLQGFSGQSQLPTQHLPLRTSHPLLASVGYAQKNLMGMIPPNIPLVEPSWSSNLLSQELKQVERDHSFWQDQDASSTGNKSGGFQTLQSDAKQQSTSRRYNVTPLAPVSRSDSSIMKSQPKFSNEIRGPLGKDNDTFQYKYERGNEVFSTNRDVSLRSSSSPTSQPSSSRSKASSESSWDGSSVKVSKSTRDKRGKKTGPSADSSTVYGKVRGGRHYDVASVDNGSSQTDDDNRDWTPSSMTDSEIAEGRTAPKSLVLSHVQTHKVPNYEAEQMSGSDSMISNALVGSGSRQRVRDKSGVVPVAFYVTETGVPFVTMLPVYNFPSEKRTSEGSASNLDGEERLDNSLVDQSDGNFDFSESLEQSEVFSSSNFKREATSREPPEEHKPDILNGDFSIHWQNLQYGRFCQNPSPVMIPPMYLQGHTPWEGPGRPISANGNLFAQLADYGPRPIPVVPLQTSSNGPSGIYRRHGEELPRYRAGTGTYLPNRKVPFGERQSSSIRNHKGNYNYDRNDHQNDREGNWNTSSRQRGASRSHNNRSQSDRLSSRSDRSAASDNRSDRPWDTYRHDSFPSHPSLNGSFRSPNSRQSSSSNMTYNNMYPLANMNSNGVAPTRPSVPSIVMMYSYDHNHGYGTPAEQLEFGSLGPVHYSGTSEVSPLSEEETVVYEQQGFQVGSPSNSSPDQPSSPQLQRSTVQRNYQLQEDLPTVVSKSRR